MLPMLYKLLHEGFAERKGVLPGFQDQRDLARGAIRTLAHQAQAIMIDNVADYFWTDGNFEGEITPSKDFPNVAPPFRQTWLEWSPPAGEMRHHQEKHGEPMEKIRTGILMDRVEIGTDEEKRIPGWWRFRLKDESVRDCRWAVAFAGFIEIMARSTIVCVNSGIMTVREDGGPLDLLVANTPDDDNSEELRNDALKMLHVPMLALSFMHCKNVVRRELPGDRQPSDKWLRRAKKSRISYKVLDIDPVRTQYVGESAETGQHKALHICRGHFKTYTDDAPLFGKVTGTFWVAQHVRGRAGEGVVTKDYNVKSPERLESDRVVQPGE